MDLADATRPAAFDLPLVLELDDDCVTTQLISRVTTQLISRVDQSHSLWRGVKAWGRAKEREGVTHIFLPRSLRSSPAARRGHRRRPGSGPARWAKQASTPISRKIPPIFSILG